MSETQSTTTAPDLAELQRRHAEAYAASQAAFAAWEKANRDRLVMARVIADDVIEGREVPGSTKDLYREHIAAEQEADAHDDALRAAARRVTEELAAARESQS